MKRLPNCSIVALPAIGRISLYCASWVLLLMCAAADAQPSPVARYVAYRLHHAKAADVELVLRQLLADFQTEAHVVVDARNNQILLSGPAEAQRIVRDLIKSIDRPSKKVKVSKKEAENTAPVVRTYECPSGRTEQIAEKLRTLFSEQPGIRIAASVDTGQLFVLAVPRVQRDVATSLASMGIKAASGAKPVVRTSSPRNNRRVRDVVNLFPRKKRAADPAKRLQPIEQFVALEKTHVARVEKMLKRLFGARLRKSNDEAAGLIVVDRAKRTIRLTLDVRRNGIMVSGPGSSAGQLVRLIRMLDGPRQLAGRRIRLMPIRRSDPTTLKRAIEAYRDGYRSSGDAVPTAPRSGIERGSFKLNPADARQSHQIRRGTIELVNFQVPAGSQDNAGAADQKATDAPEEDADLRERLRELGPDVEVETLPDLDVIIIRGRDRDVDEVTRIIKEIERLSALTVPVVDVYQLKHAGSEAVATLIVKISDDLVGGRQGRVSVTPLTKPNALLIIGWGEAVKAMKELVSKLDQPVAPESQLKVFRLKHASAVRTQTTVQQFFAGRLNLGTKAKVSADARSNSLIVQAPPRDMQEVALLLRQIDTPRSDVVFQTRIFKLKNSLAAELGATLQAAINATRGQGGGAAARKSAVLELLTVDAKGAKILKSGVLADVQITPDEHRNALIVTAPAGSMELIAALIRQLDEAPADTSQIKVFRIVNGDAESLVRMLRSLLPSQTGPSTGPQLPVAKGESSLVPLRFSVDSRSNSIIATGSTAGLRIIEALLLRLDEKEVQRRTNTVYRLKNAPAQDVARAVNDFLRSERRVQEAAPGSVSPFQQIEREVVVVPEPISNMLIISATPRFYDDIMEIVEKLDAQPPQVMIQVLIAEVILNDTDEFGVELGLQDSLLFNRSLLGDLVTTTNSTQASTPAGIVTSTQEIIQAATNTPGFLFNNSPLAELPNSGSTAATGTSNSLASQALSNFAVGRLNNELGFGGLVLSASSESVSVLIRALQETRQLEILSRPQVMTLDNQPAFIQVGQRVPRITSSTVNETGQVNNVELTDVGIILGVTPRISPDGMVVMEIDAEKSELGPENEGIPVSVSAQGGIIRSPRVNLTRAQTTVSAASGQTIVLGGLITKTKSEIHRKVPWLADVPILGALFRSDSYVNKRTELLIILTPHVVRNEYDAELIKQVEAARIHWCAADVHEIHGDTGLCSSPDCPICNAEVQVIFPDLNPRGNLPNKSDYGPAQGDRQNERRGTIPPLPSGADQTGDDTSAKPSFFKRLGRSLRPGFLSSRSSAKEEPHSMKYIVPGFDGKREPLSFDSPYEKTSNFKTLSDEQPPQIPDGNRFPRLFSTDNSRAVRGLNRDYSNGPIMQLDGLLSTKPRSPQRPPLESSPLQTNKNKRMPAPFPVFESAAGSVSLDSLDLD